MCEMDEMQECRQLGAAAERCAGKLRAMDWHEWQQTLLGLAHGAMMIDEVTDRARKMKNPALADMAEADRDAILKALDLLGWKQEKVN